jgi:hypothetical protein
VENSHSRAPLFPQRRFSFILRVAKSTPAEQLTAAPQASVATGSSPKRNALVERF